MIASTIQRQIPIGSSVTFVRRDGQRVSGVLSEIGRDHITVEHERQLVTVLLEMITGWEVEADSAYSRTISSNRVESRQNPPSRQHPPSTSGPDPAALRGDEGSNAREILLEIEIRFRAQLQAATIQLREPDFAGKLPDGHDASTAATWNRIRNSYEYAAKINELGRKFGRIRPLVHSLTEICQRYPDSSALHGHLAYLHTLTGDKQALVHYRTAAIISNDGDDWLNLAAASLPDTPALACYGLKKYFLLAKATENPPAWYVYIRLLLEYFAYHALTEYIEVPHRLISDAEARLLIETGLFLLKATDRDPAANDFASRWLAGNSPIELAMQIFRKIDRAPSEQYQRAASDIDKAIADQVTPHRRNTLDRSMGGSKRTQPDHDKTAPLPIRRGSRPRKPDWERLYQDAALAHTEGRFDDARRLFRQAIEAGGGPKIHEAFFKMELKTRGLSRARPVIRGAVDRFPDAGLFDLYGSTERRHKQYREAEAVFRKGLSLHGRNTMLRRGLAQTLVQIGSEESLREAGRIFDALEKEGKLYKKDALYQRFMLLKHNPRVNRVFDFFQTAEIRTRISGQGDLPSSITDIVIDVESAGLMDLFGLSGSFLVRCFRSNPNPIQLDDLARYLRKRGPQDELVLLNGGRIVLNPAIAFIAVQDIDPVHDQVMRILSDDQVPVIPLDDEFFQNRDDPVQSLQRILTDYLGRRDLYSSTLPVSGRRFFGREQLLVQLGDALRSGQFLGIYGLRKIGKTSLVYQLRDVQLKHDAVAYVDLQASLALTTGSCDALYWEIERDLFLRLSKTGNSDLAALLRLGREDRFDRLSEGGTEARVAFAEDIRRLLDTIVAGKSRGIARIVILLDELERILPLAGQPGVTGYLEFFGFLRGLAQTESYRGMLSCVVVAANAAISERGYWEGRENPVFVFYKSFFIPSLSEEECATMIRDLGKGMSVYWKPEAISAVFSETGGHPFFTRTLCSYIAQRRKGRPLHVTQRMVADHILPFLRDQGYLMEQVTELVKAHFPEEARALQQIALGEAPSCLTDETLRHLIGYHLVTAENDGYRVTLNLLRRWMRRRAGLRE